MMLIVMFMIKLNNKKMNKQNVGAFALIKEEK